MIAILHPGAILAAFLFGLAGSLHCLGMCGGVAGMAMLVADAPRTQLRWMLSWLLGRSASYALAGGLAASFGLALRQLPGFGMLQGALLALTSLALVLSGAQLMGWSTPLAALEKRGAVGFLRLLPRVRRWMPPRTPGRAALLGLLWGLVPCGFLYTMLTAAAAFGQPFQGMLMMGAFALGTMPMLLMAVSGIGIGVLRRRRLRVGFGALVTLTGLSGIVGLSSGSRLLAELCT